MNCINDLIYQIDISRIRGVGDITAKKLISHRGSAELVFKDNKKSLHIDELKQKLNWDSSKVAKHLLQMEFKNLTISLPGKIYKRRM